MTAVQPDASDALYHRILRHNRMIAVLRPVVPVAGVLILALPLVPFALGFSGNGITIGDATLDADTLVIRSPQFEGLTADGAAYRMVAARSESETGNLDVSTLHDLTIALDGEAGYRADVDFARAQWTMSKELLVSNEDVFVSDSTGASGVLAGATADWPAQIISSDGPVAFTFESGSSLNADTMVHDIAAATWHFTGARVEMQPAPDAGEPRADETQGDR